MADLTRPNFGEAWASEGEKLSPGEAKLKLGWVQEMMTYQYENYLQARQDEAILYLLQKGVPEYSATQEYTANKSVVVYQGNLYMATATVTGVLPTVTASWKRISPTVGTNGAVSISSGGTGATTAAEARTNLGLGTASTANLPTTNGVVVRSASNTLISRLLTGTSGNISVTNPDGVAGNINIDVGNNVAQLDKDSGWTSKGGITLPKGSSSERGVEVPGKIRYNTELQKFEGFDGTSWNALGAASEVEITTLSGDGITTSFTLTVPAFSETSTDVYISGIWQNKGTYNVSGSTITFSEAPTPGTDNIQVVSRRVVDLGVANASQVGIQDTSNYYTATTVEGALREVGEDFAKLTSYTGTISADAEWSDVPAHSDPAFDVQTQALANRVEWLKNQKITQFVSRSEFASALADLVGYEGIVNAGGFEYKYSEGSVAIPDLPGWLPAGVATPEHWGISTFVDSSAVFEQMIRWCATTGTPLKTPNKKYLITRFNVILPENAHLDWEMLGTVFYSTADSPAAPGVDNDYTIRFTGTPRNSGGYIGKVVGNKQASQNTLSMSTVGEMKVGDLIQLRTSALIHTDHRGNARKGQTSIVSKIEGTNVTINDPTEYDILDTEVSGSIQEVLSSDQIRLQDNFDVLPSRARWLMTMTSGAASGQSRYIAEWDNTTKIASFKAFSQSAWEDGLLAVGDTYTLKNETQFVAFAPATVKIYGKCSLERDFHASAAAGDLGYLGFSFRNITNLDVENISVKNFSHAGVHVVNCYRPIIKNPVIYNANRAYKSAGNANDGTGYGLSVTGCYRAKIIDGKAVGCRRGFDANGTISTDYHTEFIRCHNEGGGTTYTGDSFFPALDWSAENSGMGSHGGGFYTKMIDCSANDTFNHIASRGKRNRVKNFTATGLCVRPIRLYYNDGFDVDGYDYDLGVNEVGSWSDSDIQIRSQRANAYPVCFLTLWLGQVRNMGEISIDNVRLSPLGGPVIQTERSGTVPPLNIGRVEVFFATGNTGITNTRFRFIHKFDGEAVLGAVNIAVKPALRGWNSAEIPVSINNISQTLIDPNDFTITEPLVLGYANMYLVLLDTDSVQTIPVGTGVGMAMVDIFDVRANRTYRGVGMLLQSNLASDRSPLQATNKVDVEIKDTPLTGTTGTNGKVSLAFRPSLNDRLLFVENRTGASIQALISLKGLMLA